VIIGSVAAIYEKGYAMELVNNFIFDVDGTLTPSRRSMNTQFSNWFEKFSSENNVFLVTGSDRDKTIEQIGSNIYNLAKRVYNCSGNDAWEKTNNVYTSNWKLPWEAEDWLRTTCRMSEFPLRTGLHIEERPGMVNFSVVGRNATMGERKLYVEFDTVDKERIRIAKEFKRLFPEIEAVVCGDTGIDIYPLGNDKSQILRDFDKKIDHINFYGDKMDVNGNDYPLKNKLSFENWSNYSYQVKDWQDTFKKLTANIKEYL